MSVSLEHASVDAVLKSHHPSLTPDHRGDQPTSGLPPVAPRIRSVDNADMSIDAWWPKLRLESREY